MMRATALRRLGQRGHRKGIALPLLLLAACVSHPIDQADLDAHIDAAAAREDWEEVTRLALVGAQTGIDDGTYLGLAATATCRWSADPPSSERMDDAVTFFARGAPSMQAETRALTARVFLATLLSTNADGAPLVDVLRVQYDVREDWQAELRIFRTLWGSEDPVLRPLLASQALESAGRMSLHEGPTPERDAEAHAYCITVEEGVRLLLAQGETESATQLAMVLPRYEVARYDSFGERVGCEALFPDEAAADGADGSGAGP